VFPPLICRTSVTHLLEEKEDLLTVEELQFLVGDNNGKKNLVDNLLYKLRGFFLQNTLKYVCTRI
jgi:hypothetical protein